MSIAVIGRIWRCSAATGNDRLVLLAIGDYADRRGVAWPSVARLSEKVRLSERQVQRCIARLAEGGELGVVRGGGRGRANVYTVLVGTGLGEKGEEGVGRGEGVSARAGEGVTARKRVTPGGRKGDGGGCALKEIEPLRNRVGEGVSGRGLERWGERGREGAREGAGGRVMRAGRRGGARDERVSGRGGGGLEKYS